jgi:hypothetical protein
MLHCAYNQQRSGQVSRQDQYFPWFPAGSLNEQGAANNPGSPIDEGAVVDETANRLGKAHVLPGNDQLECGQLIGTDGYVDA